MTNRYREAGVDITLGNTFVERIKPLIRGTYTPGVAADIGGFGGLFRLDVSACPKPVLVSSTDGVGTKLKIAQLCRMHRTVGIDLVAMCVNDILVQGARPLFFLDYLATGKLEVETMTAIVEGIAAGCRQAGCALIGGETAEMPGMYAPGEYDLAGFTVGLVDEDRVIDGSTIRPGDQMIGLASSGLHSNGFSLVRHIVFEERRLDPGQVIPELGIPLGEELLKPTRIYVPFLLPLLETFTIKGMAHITGGGLLENLPRVLPAPCQAVLDADTWIVPPIFSLLQRWGSISREEMARVFNNGIGLVLMVAAGEVEAILEKLNECGAEAVRVGEIVERRPGEPGTIMRGWD